MTKKEILQNALDELRLRGITPLNVTKKDVKDFHVHISYDNGKVGDACIDMPAGLTCDTNLPCFKDCYAKHGRMAMAHNFNLRYMNYLIWKADPKRYEAEVLAALLIARYARWDVSGDIPNRPYLQMMRRTGKKAKYCENWCMSKKFKMINQEISENGMFPKNTHLILSAWGNFQPENPHNLQVFHVRLKSGEGLEYIPKTAFECPHKCDICKAIHRGCPYGDTIVVDQHR